jgi:hypothetical protein
MCRTRGWPGSSSRAPRRAGSEEIEAGRGAAREKGEVLSEGARVWLVPDGFLPEESTGSQVSHEAICVLNTSGEEARLRISFYFEDREPIKDLEAVVGAERTWHIRLDKPEQLGGAEIPRGVSYAVRVESSVPITVQHSRMDTTQPALSLMSVMAHPVG